MSARVEVSKLRQGIELLTKEIDVPELGGSVVIKSVTIDERNKMVEYGKDAPAGSHKTVRAFLLYCVAEPTFTEADLDLIVPVMPAAAANRIITACTMFNGWTPEAEQALKNSFR